MRTWNDYKEYVRSIEPNGTATIEKIETIVDMSKDNGNEEKLIELLKAIPDTYDDLVIGINIIAKKNNKYDEIIKYIEENKPLSSDLIRYLDD